MAFRINLLEIHAANACNLTCDSCSHFSSNGHKGYLSLADADAWMKSWNTRVVPSMFRLLGGEPTLHPQLPELIEISARNWPHSRIALTTNGFYLHRHPRLPEVLGRHNVILRLTVHHRSEEYLAKARGFADLINGWLKVHRFEAIVEEAYTRWTRRHIGFGDGVAPFEDENPRKSWEVCPCRECMQLFRGRLWKCSPITYLRLQKEAYPDITAKWDRYLDYAGIAPDCSDDELQAFLGKEEEDICRMCAADPQSFDKPSPLIPLGVLKKRVAASRATSS